MNSKPQQIKMQSTKKGAVMKREDGVPAAGTAAGGPAAGDEVPSTAAAPLTPTALQPLVSEENTVFCPSCLCPGFTCWRKGTLKHKYYPLIPQTHLATETNRNISSLTAGIIIL